MVDLKEMGKRISELRKQKQLTQEQLSEMMDVSIQMISNLERGNKAIKINNVVRLSEILEVSTDYLLTGVYSVNDKSDLSGKISLLSNDDHKMIEMLVEYCLSGKSNG